MTQAPRVAAGKTKVHTASQLRAALGLSALAWDKARWAGTVPDPDRAAGTWSGHVVDDLVARAAQIAADLPDVLGDDELARLLQLNRGEWLRAQDAGLLPAADCGRFWSRASVAELAADAQALRARIPRPPLGARKCAELLAGLTGLPVEYEDIAALVERGLTEQAGEYDGWPLYSAQMLEALPANPDGMVVLAALVAERQAWIASSLPPGEAAASLNWTVADFERVAAERGIAAGRYGRYERTAVAQLGDDEEMVDRVRRERVVARPQALELMQIRDSDFEYVLGAGWVAPVRHDVVEVGPRRYRKVLEVPMYAVGDLEDALAMPEVDWEAVHAVRPGEPSPLREYARKSITRAQIVRGFCDRVREQYKVEVWPRWLNFEGRWQIDWEVREDGQPTVEQVRSTFAAHPGAAAHAAKVDFNTEVGQVINWARAMLRPGAACVLDTETTSLTGVVIEVAVVDAANGEVLLDTLVDPAEVPISPQAREVHGISDEQLADAPSWAQVYPQLMQAIGNRRVLAYNAPFDRDRIRSTHARDGLTGPLPTAWDCLMQKRSTRYRIDYRLPLGGGHRARGDCLAALRVLQEIATVAAAPRR